MTNIFEAASRLKVRFAYRGQATVEDLWDLSLADLDNIYMALRRQVNESRGESLLGQANGATDVLELKSEVVKRIVGVKLAEKEEREHAAEARARKQRIMEIIQTKQDQALFDLPVDELQSLLDKLG